MTARERQALRERFGFRCAYCQTHENEIGALLTHDHFHPLSRGGADDQTNWLYCCHACNEFKGAYFPATSTDLSLFDPRTEQASQHFEIQSDGSLSALSPRGEFTIEKLHLNRPQLLAARRRRAQMARLLAQQSQILQLLAEVGIELESLETISLDDAI